MKKLKKKERKADMSENDKINELLDSILADEKKITDELFSPARLAEDEKKERELLDEICQAEDEFIKEFFNPVKYSQITYLPARRRPGDRRPGRRVPGAGQ